MQVNIMTAINAQETINEEINRLHKYIRGEPDGQLKSDLEALLVGLEKAKTGIDDETAAALIVVPEAAKRYIKAEDVIKPAEPVKS